VVAASSSVAPAAPVPKRDVGRRPPTPAELTAAKKAYEAVGGHHFKETAPWTYHRFGLPCELTAEAAAKLPDLPFEYELQLCIGPKTAPGALRPLGRLRNLRWVTVGVDLRNWPAKGMTLTPLVAELAAVPNLEQLTLYDHPGDLLTDDVAEKLLAFKSLRKLAGHGSITDAGLEKLARHPTLELLSFQSFDKITDAALAHLAGMRNLSHLVVSGCPGPTAAGLKPFTREPRLVSLSIDGKGMTRDALAEIEKIPTLESLNIHFKMTEQDLRSISRLPRLRRLTLPSGMTYTDAGLKVLANAAALEELWLSGCQQVTDGGLKELTRLTALKTLSLFRAGRITDVGLKELARLPRLETLALYGAKQVTDAGLRELTRSKTLTGLTVEETGATEAGLRAFVADRGKQLRSLSLRDMPVTDEFVADLAARAPDLEYLSLNECKQVTDKSVGPLSRLVKLRALTALHTSISREGVVTLRRRLPDCRVEGVGP
jgi:hypothetical protein